MRALLVLSMVFFSWMAHAQFHNGKSRSEIGFLVGAAYYIGDLNPYMPFRNTKPALGLLFRYNINSRVTYRINGTYAKLAGDDALSESEFQLDRNLNFFTDIYELATGFEFNYFPFQIGHDRYKGTAYLLAEIGVFRMNPKTVSSSGAEVELQQLGTEGQGTTLSDRRHYNLTQLVVPLGIGCKISLGRRASVNFELGIRKTFTDYLDDVGSGSYVDPALLAVESGPLAAELSNRSVSGERYGKRGNPNTKDWYVFGGMMITFRLGDPSICWTK